ncbi:MAG: NUDIX domain-containing protein [Armatimonadota bacterium]|nr:NUDIX domain-containing protein [Armatimonadota bacterium]
MGVFTPHPHAGGPTAVYLRTLCFVFCQEDVLLIFRQDECGGFWNAPGGKIDRGEDPLEAAQRELREEAGITAPLGFRGVATAVVRSTGEHWTIFLFSAEVGDRTVAASDEGPLRWASPADLGTLRVFPDLPLLLPQLRRPDRGAVLAKFVYATPDPATLESFAVR